MSKNGGHRVKERANGGRDMVATFPLCDLTLFPYPESYLPYMEGVLLRYKMRIAALEILFGARSTGAMH